MGGVAEGKTGAESRKQKVESRKLIVVAGGVPAGREGGVMGSAATICDLLSSLYLLFVVAGGAGRWGDGRGGDKIRSFDIQQA
jgi:hypothetical protein